MCLQRHNLPFFLPMKPKPTVTPTPDGHHVVIDGRKWRATNPNLPEEERKKWVSELMSARRAVGAALKSGNKELENAARDRVQAAKEALGERGPKWWEDKPPTSQSNENGTEHDK